MTRGRFLTALVTYRPPGPGQLWRLQQNLRYRASDGRIFEVPAGMLADGNSGPWKNAEGEPAGWLHDWLYRIDCSERLTRSEADEIFREALIAEGFSRAYAWTQWAVVRALGGSRWQRKHVF